MKEQSIYEDVALRTNGDIYVGVVGPVRTGKSTFIKRFIETLVIPNIENVYVKERAKDELPQSGSGKTIMTAEPKFVPENSVQIRTHDGIDLSVRLVDCVGYMVDGAIGEFENDTQRMVSTPWFDHDVTLREASEIGTRKVITEHSTIGIVVTTDGSVTEIPRENYIAAENKVICELKALNKPFIVLVNSSDPDSEKAKTVCDQIKAEHDVCVLCKNCLMLNEDEICEILTSVLYEFEITKISVELPSWVDALEFEHEIKIKAYESLKKGFENADKLCCVKKLSDSIEGCSISSIDPGTGIVSIAYDLPRMLFYKTISERSGFDISDDGDLITLLSSLSTVKEEYDKVSSALKDVREKGYGIVFPKNEELILQEPEIVRQGGRYGVRLKASAPSIHMIMADVETEVAPGIGGESSSEEVISCLLGQFEGDSKKIWESNMFGKSLYDVAGEGLNAKIKRMPEEARIKLRETLEKIINDGSNGLICIIL